MRFTLEAFGFAFQLSVGTASSEDDGPGDVTTTATPIGFAPTPGWDLPSIPALAVGLEADR